MTQDQSKAQSKPLTLLIALALSPILATIVVCGFGEPVVDDLLHPTGWKEAGFKGVVVKAGKGWALVKTEQAGEQRMPRAVGGMNPGHPNVGDHVLKHPGDVRYELLYPDNKGAYVSMGAMRSLHDGATGLGYLVALWMATIVLFAVLVAVLFAGISRLTASQSPETDADG